MTLKQMASAIRSHVLNGVNGADSLPFSIEQLEDEILLSASSIIIQMMTKGGIRPEILVQRIDGIKLECTDISKNCDVPTDSCAPHFLIPDINRAVANPITFLGSIDSKISFKVYYDRDWRFHKYRLATSKAPFAWISTSSNESGMYDVYLFNLGKYSNLKFISLDILLDNPYDLLKTDYFEQFSAAEFYAPMFIQNEIINQLSQKYINYYRQLHMTQKPNTQQS